MTFRDHQTDVFFEVFTNIERLSVQHWVVWSHMELGYIRGAFQRGNYHGFKDNVHFFFLVLILLFGFGVLVWDAALGLSSK